MLQRPLWPNQQAALAACIATLGRKPGYVQMPTGSGKSEVIRRLSMDWLTEPQHKVVIAVPNHTLALQHRADYIRYGITSYCPTLLMQGFPLARASRIIISTYASLIKVLGDRQFPQTRVLLIADECHHCNETASLTSSIIQAYRNRIGFSATPWSESCSFLFADNLLYAQTLNEAQNSGLLCEYSIDRQDSLTPSSLLRWQMFFVKDSSRFERPILAKSVFYDDTISPHRPYGNSQIIDEFRYGSIPCVYVNRMLLEGFDCPTVKNIYIEKETSSDILAMQMIGRGLRKIGKQVCRIYISNSKTIDTLHSAIERSNHPERHAWHGKS